MWVAKLKAWHSDSYSADKTKGIDASYASYNLNAYEKDGKSWLSRVIIVEGRDYAKLIKAIKSDPRLTVEEVKGRQVIFTMPCRNQFHALQMDDTVFMMKPIIAKKGIEYWTVGSTDKRRISALVKKINALKPKAWAKLISLKREKVDLFIPNILSRLTEKQSWAYETACKFGYYEYPRGMDLQDIAKKVKMPVSTFREHLRIAESKLLPALANSISFE